ncbi:tyrosine-type recombinase/integrase [candidate division KSB1 bacterium]|nr:tyrosine-type recombinase/integrase [candidate division KSB1 bacterium]
MIRFIKKVSSLTTVFQADSTRSVDRDVPINNFLSGIIETINEDNKHLFHNPDTGKHLTTIKKSFASALRRAEIINFRFHDLRHTFSSHLSMSGIEENIRAELLGHSKRTITSSYTHTNWERKIEAVEIIGKLCGQYLDNEKSKL